MRTATRYCHRRSDDSPSSATHRTPIRSAITIAQYPHLAASCPPVYSATACAPTFHSSLLDRYLMSRVVFCPLRSTSSYEQIQPNRPDARIRGSVCDTELVETLICVHLRFAFRYKHHSGIVSLTIPEWCQRNYGIESAPYRLIPN